MSQRGEVGEADGAAVRMHWGVKIPLRDGVDLCANVYLPKHQRAPSPALFVLTPYVAQRNHEHALYFARNGYPFLTVDVRGRGNSGGDFRPFINDGRDGFDIVEWLAQQPYCNGKVAMWGGSYCGFVQWATAVQSPPHLVTIVPTASPYLGVDFPMCGNVFPSYLMRWLTLVAGRTSQINLFADEAFWRAQFRAWFESGTPFCELDAFVGLESDIFREWLSHPHADAYWDQLNPGASQYAELSIPVLTITGSYDDDQRGALTHYRNHLRAGPGGRDHYLVIGPWDHAGTLRPQAQFLDLEVAPASVIDMLKLHLDWYDWVLKGARRPSFLERHVTYYLLGAEEWRYADSLDAVTTTELTWYLHGGAPGKLATELPCASEPDCYIHDSTDISRAALESTVDPESRKDQTMIRAAADAQLVYESGLFDHAAEVSGFFTLSLWLGIDCPDTDFRVSIWDGAPDGSATLLSADCLRARYRESPRKERLIRTTEPLQYDFKGFPFIAHRVERGHRLRLIVGPIHSIHSQRNRNSGRAVARETLSDARLVRVCLFHDAEHPSALRVPLAGIAVSAGERALSAGALGTGAPI